MPEVRVSCGLFGNGAAHKESRGLGLMKTKAISWLLGSVALPGVSTLVAGTTQAPSAMMDGVSLSFIQNQGQFDDRVRFAHTSSSLLTYLTDDGLLWTLREPAEFPIKMEDGQTSRPQYAQVSMSFEGREKTVAVIGRGPCETRLSYFIGRDRSRWASDVPTWQNVHYEGLYPGIDAVVRKVDGKLEYDLVLAPGADLSGVCLRVDGASRVMIDDEGALVAKTAAGTLRQTAPRAVVVSADGVKRDVPCYFRQVGATRFAFDTSGIDDTESLIIDPAIDYQPLYFTYAGGGGHDTSLDIALTTHGRATITGATLSADYPTTAGAFDMTQNSPPGYDVFVAQFSVDGSVLKWATYIGGTNSMPGLECGYGVATDAQGSVYVAGLTQSADFPTTAGAFQQTSLDGGSVGDAFVLKLNNVGTTLVYSTFLSGDQEEQAQDIAVDSSGNAYVCGTSLSNLHLMPPDFPTTAGVVEPLGFGIAGSPGGFVSKISANGSTLIYSTWLRAMQTGLPLTNGITRCAAIALDEKNPNNVHAYVTGEVEDPGMGNPFPTTPNAFQGAYGGGALDGFVTGFNATASTYVFSSYLGGDDTDYGRGIAVSSNGQVLVTGGTDSEPGVGGFPINPGPGSYVPGNLLDSFITRINPAAPSSLLFSEYHGGTANDVGFDVWADNTGRTAYFTGVTYSINFPIVGVPNQLIQTDPDAGLADAFLVRLRAGTIDYSTYLGGALEEAAFGIAVDDSAIYLTGQSEGSDFYTQMNFYCPITGFDTTNNNGSTHLSSGYYTAIPQLVLDSTSMLYDPFVLKLERP